MDWLKQESWKSGLKKYRYVVAVLLLGLILMLLPGEKEAPGSIPAAVPEKPDLQTSLGLILSKLEGAGRVEVLLTEETGSETLYQTDEDRILGESTRDQRSDTVLLTGSDRNQTGLVRQTNPPGYRGALVLCQGADNASVRLQIVQAVRSVTGLGSDCITVLKMK